MLAQQKPEVGFPTRPMRAGTRVCYRGSFNRFTMPEFAISVPPRAKFSTVAVVDLALPGHCSTGSQAYRRDSFYPVSRARQTGSGQAASGFYFWPRLAGHSTPPTLFTASALAQN